ncbi:MAG: hypothetical protein H6Q33_2585 [Deltaproteobacteria bacterium]|nr:hypothetical protein [Deltaproteobacteria bacterium]
MGRRRQTVQEQGSLFDRADAEAAARELVPNKPSGGRPVTPAPRKWRMPTLEGKTVAEIRVRWPKRLTPAQVARVEAELGALPKALTQLGFGTVAVERTFVRRHRTIRRGNPPR